MKRFRTLLVGLGRIGCGYDSDQSFVWNQVRSGDTTLTHARALACHPQIELVAGVDANLEARKRFSNCYHRPSFADLVAFQKHSGGWPLDLVVFAVPPSVQPFLVEELLALTVPKLLLLEKPVATDMASAERIRRACDFIPDLEVAVNYIRRYLPAVHQIQTRLNNGDLGQLVHGQLVYGKGLLSNGSHFVNLAESWLGPLVHSGPVELGPTFADFDYETNLTVTAERHFGAPLKIQSIGGKGLRAGELDLWFSKGRLRWNNNGHFIDLWVPDVENSGDSHRSLVPVPRKYKTDMDHYQHHVVHSLVHHLNTPAAAPIHCSLEEGLTTLKLLEGAFNARH